MTRMARTTDDGDAGRLLAGALPVAGHSHRAPAASSRARADHPTSLPVAPAAGWLAGPSAPLRDRRTVAAAVILLVASSAVIGVLLARQPLAGVDAAAYWHAARSWLAGGDPYQPTGPWWPYVYAPWLLPLFVPWAMLPWGIASTLWVGIMLGLFLATVAWAYRRRPLATAVAVLALSVPVGIVIGSGNVALYLVFAVWATRWLDSRSAGLVWALATAMKWIPGVFLVVLKPGARRWGLLTLGVAAGLSLLTWQQTLEQLKAVAAMGVPSLDPSRSLRLDHLVFLWAAVPWLWESRPSSWPVRIGTRLARLRGLAAGQQAA